MVFRYNVSLVKYRSLGNIFYAIKKRYLKFRMAACFSSSVDIACPSVYVLSHVPKMADCLREFALPGIPIRPIDLSGVSEKEPVFSEAKLTEFKDAEIVVCDGNLLAKVYKNLPNLKWAHCTWAGVDSLLNEMDKQPSFTLTRHSGEAFCGLMAEYVLCHILNCERQTKLCWQNQNSKIWSQDGKIGNYRSLPELTITILGVGNMASQIAKILTFRGVSVYGFAKKPRSTNQFGNFEGIFTKLEDLPEDTDYLINTLPSTPLTRGILSPSVIQKCKKNPVFINVGRGDAIDENVLVEALRNGQLSGAVLDVFEAEPLPESSQLWDMPQVTITPHVAAVSKPHHIADEFFNVFTSYMEGHGLKNIVRWSEGY